MYLAATFAHIVLHSGYFGSISDWSPLWQFSMIGFQIAGVAIILLGLLGIAKRIDVAVRLYLLYLLATFVVDTIFLIYYFLWNDNCGGVTGLATTALMGQAFVCGFMRILSYLFVAAAICAEVYCLFIVWSLCEDVHEGVNGPGLWELLPAKEEAFERKREHMGGEREGPFTTSKIIGMAYYANNMPGAYPAPYGAFESRCFSIFGGGGGGGGH